MDNIHKIIPMALMVILFAFSNGFSQTAPPIQWQNTIGGSSGDNLYSMTQTSDKGYILGGFSQSNISGDKTENCIGDLDYWIVKTDSMGILQWENTIGGSTVDELYCIQQTKDGGYIMGGYSGSDISGDKTENGFGFGDFWIVKTDSTGIVEWQNTIGGTKLDELHCLQQTADGGYILGGFSQSDISGDKTENSFGGSSDYWIVKTDSVGIIEWQNTIGGSMEDILYFIQQTNDGGYILGGRSKSNISGDKTENCLGLEDYWIIKTDSSGNIEWQNTIGGNDSDFLHSIEQTTDGGYMLGGASRSNISGDKTENSLGYLDCWMVKTDSIGGIQWQNTIGGSGLDWIYSIQQTSEGGYMLGIATNSDASGDKTENSLGLYDFWIVKTDSIGNILWQNTIGGNDIDALFCMELTSDGGCILGGYSSSNISGDKTENAVGSNDYWIVKIAPDTITSINPYPSSSGSLLISPNPFTDELFISDFSYLENHEVKIYNVYGRLIAQKTISASLNNPATWDNSYRVQTSGFSPGIYFVEVQTSKQKSVSKIVKQ